MKKQDVAKKMVKRGNAFDISPTHAKYLDEQTEKYKNKMYDPSKHKIRYKKMTAKKASIRFKH